MTSDPSPEANHEQSQDVQVGGDFRVEGQGHRVDFSQTHIGTQIIQISAATVTTRPLLPDSPYKGLKKFRAEDRDYFFGREPLAQDLLKDCQARSLILLLGASGSGKSSVVQAGLLPQLRELPGGGWLDLTCKPDRDPFMALFAALVQREYDQTAAAIALRPNPDTLIQLVTTLKPAQTRWLIYLDQFEELFTLSQPEQREAFIQNLVNLYQFLQAPEHRSIAQTVKLILTMRTDFLDRFSAYPGLNAITQGNIRLMTDMHEGQLRQAIEQPAARHGVLFEQGLAEEIVQDLRGQPGALPLLQYTLDLLWQRQDLGDRDRTLHRHTYEELGRVQGALQKRVDEIYGDLLPTEQDAVKRIFIRLVDISEASREPDVLGRAVSRRAQLSDFRDDSILGVVRKLVDANLLVSDRPLPAAPDPTALQPSTVEIAHETLLTSWPTLRRWIEDSREVIVLKNRLHDDAQRWNKIATENPAQAEGDLWRGSNLQRVEELDQERLFDLWYGGLDAEEKQFITASRDWRDRTQKEREAQLKREKELYRKTALGAIAAGVFAVCTLGLGLLTVLGNMQRQQVQAIAAGALVSRSQLLYENHNQLEALIESIKALQELKKLGNPDPQTLRSLRTIILNIQEYNRLEGHERLINSVDFRPDGGAIASASEDQTVRLWNLTDGTSKTLQHQDTVWEVQFSRDGRWLASSAWDGTVKLWTAEGNFVRDLKLEGIPRYYGISFSADSRVLATATRAGNIVLWDVQSGKPVRILKDPDAFPDVSQGRIALYSVAFHPKDNSILAATGDHNDYGIKIWDLKSSSNNTPLELGKHRDIVYSLAFSSDGQLLASAGKNGEVKIWNIATRQQVGAVQLPDENVVWSISFSPDGQFLVSGDSDSKIQLWRVQDIQRAWNNQKTAWQTPAQTLLGHTNSVNRAIFHPLDSQKIGSASEDATIRFWQIAAGQASQTTQLNALLQYSCDRLKDYFATHHNNQAESERQLCSN